MKTRVLADTAFWVALFDARDEHHQAAADAWKRTGDAWTPITTQHIVDETMTYLNCSLRDHAKAMAFHERMRGSGIPVFSATETVREQALDIFFRFADKDFSFTDCVSFAVMKNEGITQYAGFDDHFKAMGFQPIVSS